MDDDARIDLLARMSRSLGPAKDGAPQAKPASIVSIAAASYGSRPSEDATVPTGFDPLAVALFEAIVEGAYLVASADGLFDAKERRAFDRLVAAVCGGVVASSAIESLVNDLEHQLRRDGLDRRIEAVAGSVTKKEQAREILRVAGLLAAVSDDVSAVERDVLLRLAGRCGLDPADVDAVIADARRALASLPRE